MTEMTAALAKPSLEQRAVNAIRVLAMDAVQQANSGHPGLPMGAADLAYVLWSRFLKHNPEDPRWMDRDRFILSGGHGSMLLYALLHLTGYDLSLDDIKQFRQWESKTPGHPESGHTPGVEATTGPLGQGISMAVGMAMAEAHLGSRLNQGPDSLIDHFTYVLATDGDMMEGVQAEAASLAGHLGLGKLIVLYDDNRISIDGSTDLTFSEDVTRRFDAYDWHVQRIDGHNREAVAAAITAAQQESDRPSLIAARTHIALGSPNKQDSASSHGSPLGAEEIDATKQVYGWPADPPFFVPEDVREHFLECGGRHKPVYEEWNRRVQEFRSTRDGEATWAGFFDSPRLLADAGRPKYETGTSTATRVASGNALAWLSPRVHSLWGGSADLAPSNMTLIPDQSAFSSQDFSGRNLHFGVREHAMGAAMNGMALHGGIVPYGGTFLVFADYMRPAMRLSALMQTRCVYVMTHDSIFLGEDGPTHQPIAHLASLRAMPGIRVIRPADGEETTQAWELALSLPGPTVLSLTRQGLPELNRSALGIGDHAVERGAYIALDAAEPDTIVFATGSELHPCISAAMTLNREGRAIRVVAVPCWELFAEQDQDYQDSILAPNVAKRVAVEAGSSFGWERFVGMGGTLVAMDRFGASAPASDLAREFGFTPESIQETLSKL